MLAVLLISLKAGKRMSDKQLIRGTMILTASIIISKALGLIYIFPFKAIVGLEGLALYGYGYTPYTVLLSLSTLGIPLAVSKFVSKYNALGDYRTGHRLFQSGIVVLSITGVISFIALFFLADPIARHVLDPSDLQGNTIEDAVFTIRMVSVALLVVPVMSLIRGYFQGYGSMGPTAVSQVIEQIIRIVFILVLTYLIINVWQGTNGTAVGFATFGAFVGALGGLGVLLFYWLKRKHHIQRQVDASTVDNDIPLSAMYKELITYALPISFVGLAIPLFQMVDLMTFNSAMRGIGFNQGEVDMYYGAFTQAAHKLILIPVSVATAMSLTILPTVTKSFIHQEYDNLQKQITQTYQIILFLTIPASVGLVLLSDSAYAVLFGLGDMEIGAMMLKYYAPVAVLFSIFTVTAALLQGINRQKFAVIALLAGVVFKAGFNYLLIVWTGPGGAVWATAVGYAIAIGINVWAIGKYAKYNYIFLLKRLLLIGIFAFIMGAAVVAVRAGVTSVFPLTSWKNAFVVLLLSMIAGVAAYGYLSIRSGLAGKILGQRFRFLNKKKLGRQGDH
ncbi:Membrane protein involved in the export of O-antigen and teichoic acid [Evansella caseinilytica]|uniref:Membrane protein involved in the export of O-antigen and teichoic acid n=1 Tax=Evansella caseinilytica TaxID=1503961 RepID=A0A1H3RUV4_9BACI|nr:polysaccharide biosynthesis protein [Evansella caseinilytica]SDZ29504.1 Membrane protein involved in the export of O-antigen and teichoic acid [Evansella caseinilytica]